MKWTKVSLIMALIVAATLAVTESGHAGVVITFSQVGNNVVATTSGTIRIPSSASSVIVSGKEVYGGGWGLYMIDGSFGQSDGGAGTLHTVGISVNPSGASGSEFGFYRGFLYWSGAVPNETFAPVTTWVWSSHTLSSIGLGALATSPTTVWSGNYGSGNTVSFAAIPEASAAVFCLASLSVLSLRRRR
jgi:hypothetical protein